MSSSSHSLENDDAKQCEDDSPPVSPTLTFIDDPGSSDMGEDHSFPLEISSLSVEASCDTLTEGLSFSITVVAL